MNSFTSELLAEATLETLESAAFVLAEHRDTVWPRGTPIWRAEIRMSGVASGLLVLASTPGFAAALAANLLGTEMEDAEAVRKREDALGEVLNMICGVLLDRTEDKGIGSSMGTPVVHRVDENQHAQAMARAVCAVGLIADDEPFDIAILPYAE